MIISVINFKRVIIFCCIAVTLSFAINTQIASTWSSTRVSQDDTHTMITYAGYRIAKNRWGRTGCISEVKDWQHSACVTLFFVPMLAFYAWAMILDIYLTKPLAIVLFAIACYYNSYVSSMERWNMMQLLLIDIAFNDSTNNPDGYTDAFHSYHMDNNGSDNRNTLNDIEDRGKNNKEFKVLLALPFIFNDVFFVKQLHRVQDFYSHTFFAYFVVKHYDNNPGAFGGTDPRKMGYFQLKDNALTKVAYQSILENDTYFTGKSKVTPAQAVDLGLPSSGFMDDSWDTPSLSYYRNYAINMAEDNTSYVLFWAYGYGLGTGAHW